MAWRVTSEEIDTKEQEVLEDNEENMLRLMNVYNVCMSLLEREVINDLDVHNILQQQTKVDKLHNFIARLAMRGEEAFHVFLDVLRNSSNPNHVQLAAILESCMAQAQADCEAKQAVDTPRTRATHAALREHDTRIRTLEQKTHAGGDAENFQRLFQEIEGLKVRLAEQENGAYAMREENQKLKARIAELEREIHTLRADGAKWEEESKRLKERVQVLEQKNVILDHERRVLEQEQGEEKEQLHSLEEQVGQLSARLEGGDRSKVSPRATIQPANRFQPHQQHGGRGGANRSPTRDRWK